MISLKHRSKEEEVMDGFSGDPRDIEHAYRLIERVNRFLGGTRVILKYLRRYSGHWPAGATIRVLDLGSGATDIPRAIANWCRKKKIKIQILALDILSDALRYSRNKLADYPEIRFIQASAFDLPFKKGSFDYVISSMFFHHLDDEALVKVLRESDRAAQKGIILNDLLRYWRAYLWILFFSCFTKNKMFKSDAPLSVLKGFRPHEMKALIRKTSLPYLKFRYHFGHRFALAGEKPA